jgi:hypothetical protein
MMTKGEYRMWSKFNHISNDKVGKIRRQAAELIDLIDDIATPDNGLSELDREIMRLKALAQTAIEEGAMWAVKAATKGPIE